MPASPALNALWHQQQGGVVQPSATAELRQGRFLRRYAAWDGPDIGARIAGGNDGEPWQAFWTPSTAWATMPNVLSVKRDKSFDNNGISVATITVENILYDETGAGDSLFHIVKRGALAPYRGYSMPGRPGWPSGLQDPTWYRLLERNAQIRVSEGYNGEEMKVWTGLIDSVDLDSRPDRITITARDFGQVLADQEMFGWNHDPLIKEPVTFIDRKEADKLQKVGYDPEAGTFAAHHPANYALDTDSSTYWRSRTYNTPDATDYVQLRVPGGRYQSVYLWPKYEGVEAYISIFLKPRTDGKPNTFNGADVPDNGWLDQSGGVGGAPLVPGTLGGVPYVKLLPSLDAQGHYHTFGVGSQVAELECGPGSIIRISFRNLAPTRDDPLPAGEPVDLPYAAGVTRFIAMKRNFTPGVKEKHQIVIDDVADAIKVILRWAGFKEWNVESTGVRLKKAVVIGRDQKLTDAINLFRESVNYVFFMGPPSADDDSLGVPTFRNPRVITDDDPVEAVDEAHLLTGVRVHLSDESLSYSIRMRGRAAKSSDPAGSTGFLFGGGGLKRVKYTFYPPWARGDDARLAGILKHVIHQDDKLNSAEDCMFACYYVALQQALQSVTGTIEVPGYPDFDLDSFILVEDTGSGMWMRFYVAALSSDFEAGESASYKLTLTGTWADTPDVQTMKDTINAAVSQRSNE